MHVPGGFAFRVVGEGGRDKGTGGVEGGRAGSKWGQAAATAAAAAATGDSEQEGSEHGGGSARGARSEAARDGAQVLERRADEAWRESQRSERVRQESEHRWRKEWEEDEMCRGARKRTWGELGGADEAEPRGEDEGARASGEVEGGCEGQSDGGGEARDRGDGGALGRRKVQGGRRKEGEETFSCQFSLLFSFLFFLSAILRSLSTFCPYSSFVCEYSFCRCLPFVCVFTLLVYFLFLFFLSVCLLFLSLLAFC